MVQNYLNLADAAKKLGVSEDQLRSFAQKRDIRAFADGKSWKFKPEDLDSFRSSGKIRDNSQTDPMMTADEQVVLDGSGVLDFDLEPTEHDSGVRLGLGGQGGPHTADASDIMFVPDTAASSMGDSAVRLGEDIEYIPSDSDIRLAFDEAVKPKNSMESTEELKFEPSSTGEIYMTKPDSPKSSKGHDSSSLSDSSSDVDFKFDDELSAGYDLADSNPNTFSNVDPASSAFSGAPKIPKSGRNLESTAALSGLSDSDLKLTGSSASDSGINLDSPDDSGISLEKSDPSASTSSEFELSLASDSDIFSSDNKTDHAPGFMDDDEEEAAKTLSPAKGSSDSGSDSDFELAIDEDADTEGETGSEVVAIEDEDDEEEDEDDFEDDFTDEIAAAAGTAAVGGAAAVASRGRGQIVTTAAAPWPVWIFPVVLVNTLLLGVLGVMLYEMSRNSFSFHQPPTITGKMLDWATSAAETLGIKSAK